MVEFIMTLSVIALIFVISTIIVAMMAGSLLKLRKEPSSNVEPLQDPQSSSANLRRCARNVPWP